MKNCSPKLQEELRILKIINKINPKISQNGNMYECVYEGSVGIGNTPYDSMINFCDIIEKNEKQ